MHPTSSDTPRCPSRAYSRGCAIWLGWCHHVQLPLKLGYWGGHHGPQVAGHDHRAYQYEPYLGKCRADGQVYVALSRAKTMEGLRLEQPLQQGQIHSADVVLELYSRCR